MCLYPPIGASKIALPLPELHVLESCESPADPLYSDAAECAAQRGLDDTTINNKDLCKALAEGAGIANTQLFIRKAKVKSLLKCKDDDEV